MTKKDLDRLIGLLNKDAVEDFKKDHEAAFLALEKKEQKRITKSTIKLSATLVNEYFNHRETEG